METGEESVHSEWERATEVCIRAQTGQHISAIFVVEGKQRLVNIPVELFAFLQAKHYRKLTFDPAFTAPHAVWLRCEEEQPKSIGNIEEVDTINEHRNTVAPVPSYLVSSNNSVFAQSKLPTSFKVQPVDPEEVEKVINGEVELLFWNPGETAIAETQCIGKLVNL